METLLISAAQSGILHFVHWVIIFPAILMLTRLVVGRLFTVTFPTMFIGTYALLIFAQAPNIYMEIQVPLYLMAVWAVPFIYLLGVGASLFMAGRLGRAGVTPPVTVSQRDRFLARLTPVATAAIILLPILFIFDRGVGSISLIFVLFNPTNVVEAMQLRIGGLESNISPILSSVYSYGRALVMPTYIALLSAYAMKGQITKRHLIVAFIPAAIFVAFTAAKAPLAFVIGAAFLTFYLVHGPNMSLRTAKFVVVGTLLGLILPGLIYPLLHGKTGTEGASFLVELVWRRISWVPSSTAALYFEAFGNAFDFLGASSNRILARLAGEQSVSAAALIYDEYFRGSIAGGLVNSCFFASFYADWGIGGVVWGTIICGLLSGGIQVYFDGRQQDLTTTAVRAMVLIASMQLHVTNFYSVSFGRGFLSIPIALFLFELLLPRSRIMDAQPAPSNSAEVESPPPAGLVQTAP